MQRDAVFHASEPLAPPSAPEAPDAPGGDQARRAEHGHSMDGPRPHLLDASMFWNATGGVHRVLTSKHALLPAHGWRHTVLAPGAAGLGHIDCGGLPMPHTGGYRVVVNRRRMARLIEAARPDVVEAADPYTLAWSVLDAAEHLCIPTVAFCHSNLPALAARLVGGAEGLATRRGRWAARRSRTYLVNLLSHFDMVLAPSRVLAEQLRGWGVSRNVLHQPLGVDCSVFRPEARDDVWRAGLEQRLGLRPGTHMLVYTGRFAPEKNLGLLVDTVKLLGPGHALLAVGSGPSPPRGDNVFVLRPEFDSARLARLLASADVYVHAGNQETFGLGALEAMACGLPVVVPVSGGLGELAADAGTVVLRQRAREWADAIGDRLASTDRKGIVAALARAREHDWSRIVEQMARRYGHLLPGAPVQAVASVPGTLPGVEVLEHFSIQHIEPLHGGGAEPMGRAARP